MYRLLPELIFILLICISMCILAGTVRKVPVRMDIRETDSPVIPPDPVLLPFIDPEMLGEYFSCKTRVPSVSPAAGSSFPEQPEQHTSKPRIPAPPQFKLIGTLQVRHRGELVSVRDSSTGEIRLIPKGDLVNQADGMELFVYP